MSTTATDRWKRNFPKQNAIRESIVAINKNQGDKVVVTENIPCNSVSMAAGLIIGGHVNGWNAWKNPTGKSMDEIIRKVSE